LPTIRKYERREKRLRRTYQAGDEFLGKVNKSDLCTALSKSSYMGVPPPL
jgi:hypothetical protein